MKLYRDKVVEEKYFFIISGLFISNYILNMFQGFNEELFLDSVDQDFSLRLLEKNYHIFQVMDALAIHSIGSPTSLNILSISIPVSLHSPSRTYFMIRDSLVTIQRHWKLNFYLILILSINLIISSFIKIIFFKKRRDYFDNTMKGIFSFLDLMKKSKN